MIINTYAPVTSLRPNAGDAPQRGDLVLKSLLEATAGEDNAVATLMDRDALTVGTTLDPGGLSSGQREVGMKVYVAEDATTYELNIPGFNNLTPANKLAELADNTNWVAAGGGATAPVIGSVPSGAILEFWDGTQTVATLRINGFSNSDQAVVQVDKGNAIVRIGAQQGGFSGDNAQVYLQEPSGSENAEVFLDSNALRIRAGAAGSLPLRFSHNALGFFNLFGTTRRTVTSTGAERAMDPIGNNLCIALAQYGLIIYTQNP